MKKAQLQLPFTYIFALVVAGLIIIFGFYAITKLIGVGDDVQNVKFVTDLRNQINSIYYNSPGTNLPVKLLVPSGIVAVCFSNNQYQQGDFIFKDADELATTFVNEDYNVFFSLQEGKSMKNPALKVEHLKANNICIQVEGGVLNAELVKEASDVRIQ